MPSRPSALIPSSEQKYFGWLALGVKLRVVRSITQVVHQPYKIQRILTRVQGSPHHGGYAKLDTSDNAAIVMQSNPCYWFRMLAQESCDSSDCFNNWRIT